MTIKEAVEYYNSIQEQIKSVHKIMNKLISSVHSREMNPLNYCELEVETVHEILNFLNDYIKHVEDKLNKEFE